MKKILKSLPLVALLFSSCSLSKVVTSGPDGTRESVSQGVGSNFNDIIKSEEKSREDVVKQFEQIVANAQAEGPEAIKYLSSDLFLKANDASLNGDSTSAVVLLKIIVSMNQEDLYLRKRLAVELIKANFLEESKQELEYLIKKGDDDLSVKAKLLLAGVFSALKNGDKAIELYRDIIAKKGGEMPDACAFLAKAYSANEKYKRAFSTLDYCAIKSPKNKTYFTYYKARIEFERDHHKEAIALLKESIKLDSENFQSVMLLGHLYEMGSQRKNAISLYEKFIEANPSNFSILAKLVDLLFSEGAYEKVIPHLEKLIAVDTDNLNLKVRLGVLYTEIGKVDEAKDIFSEILAKVPDSDKVLYYLASLYQHTSESEKAIEYFSKIKDDSALYHDSNIQIAQILNAFALNERKIENKLFEFVSSASKKSSELNVELNIILAGYFETNKNYHEAISVLEKVKDLTEFNDGHEYYLAAMYERVKDFSKAEKLVRSMLNKNPENAHALNFMGYSILERGGDMQKAFEYISKAVSLRPQDGYIRDSLSWYYYKTGKYDLAYAEAKKAFSLVSDDVVITKHLALIYQAMSNYDKAKEFYVEALKNCKQQSERDDVIKSLESLEASRLPASR